MNQTNNLSQWKNHTDEQKADYNFHSYTYETQHEMMWMECIFSEAGRPHDDNVYRLKIEKHKWYFIAHNEFKSRVLTGKDLLKIPALDTMNILRPAKPSEIPQPETLEDKIKAKWPQYEVVMCKEREESFDWVLNIPGLPLHINAQSMKGFQGYVYEIDGLKENVLPVICDGSKYIQPVAVLFEKEIKEIK